MPHAHPSTRYGVSRPFCPRQFEALSRRSRSPWLLLLFTACLLLGGDRAAAQNVQHTKNSPGVGMRSIFKVNPATNALELEVPFGATGYPQRGGASVAPAVSYSSRIWRMAYLGPIYGTATQQGPPPLVGTRVVPRMSENSRMGWTYSLEAPYVETTAQDAMGGEVYDAWGNSESMCTTGSGSACCFIDRIRIHMPGGGTQEFRSSDHPICYTQTGLSAPLPDDLYSVDGSRMHFRRSENRLYLPDGSYWVLASGQTPAQLFDRNGNLLLNGFTDGLNRSFGNPLDTSLGTDYTYAVPGVGGTPVAYTFRWRYLDQVLTTPQPLPNFSDDCGNTTCAEPYLFKSDTGASEPVKTAGGSGKINPLVLYQIVLPHDASDPNPPTYTFTYNVYAEIDKVVYPTGGYERFAYGVVEGQQSGTFVYAEGNRGVTDRWVSARGDGTDEAQAHWQYAWTDAQGQLHKGEISPDGTRTERFQYYTSFGITFWSFTDARAGRPTEERVYNAAGQLIRRKLSEWAVTGSDNCFTGAYSSCTATRNPRLTKTVEIIIEPGGQALAKTTTYGYDLTYQYTTGVNQTSVNEYDFVSVDQNTAQNGDINSFTAPTQPLRKAETAYLDASNSAYRLRNILGLPTSVTVKDGAGAVAAISTTAYDEPAYQLGNTYGTMANWADPGALRGNATTVGRWLNTTGGYVQTHAQYDQLGNVAAVWDAGGNQTQMAYSPAYSYAFLTSITSAAPDPDAVTFNGLTYAPGTFGSTTGFTVSTNYDTYTGLVTSETDANGKTTVYDYSDPLNRLKVVTRPDDGTTTYVYGRQSKAGRVSDYVQTATAIDSGRSIISTQFFDGLGRPDRSFLYEGGSPVQYLTSDTQFDAAGRVWRVSNPYRTSGFDQALNPAGEWTTNEYDALGRVKKVTTPDGSVVTTAYDGTNVTVTDQTGKKRSSVSDALGRLKQVTEDPTIGGLNYQTNYTYDALDNLRKVDQGGQLRFFMYDSLGRLVRARNPEQAILSSFAVNDPVTQNSQWSVAYAYDDNGNLVGKTDARDVTTNYAYDRLNRVIITHYTDSVLGVSNHTKDVERHYDGAINGKGRFWYFNWDAAGNQTRFDSHTAVDEYDAMGRPRKQRQRFLTNGATSLDYTTTHTYDKVGNVLTQTYPSGHTVTYAYDAAGRPSGFSGYLGDGVGRTYADEVKYSVFGGIEQERFGTQTPLYHKLHYNRRGQLFDIRLSTQSLQSNEWDWNRGALVNYYSGNYAWEGNLSTPPATDNNGNLWRQQHWVPADDQISSHTFTQQTYTYDALNRLSSVTEAPGANYAVGSDSFTQAYTYDRWGNRTVNLAQSQNSPGAQLDFERGDLQNTNRLYAPGDLQLSAPQRRMQYDAAGNLVFDAYTGAGGRAYDGENRMTAAADSSGGTAFYTYDADGRRVKRKIASEEWWQVYGMGGELLAEYRAGAAPYAPSKEYGYRGGELLVTMASGDDQRLKRFVTSLYYGALQRDPTAQELQEKSNQLAEAGAQGPSQLLAKAKEIARALFVQTSYETSPSKSDAQYVTDLYYAYLQRGPDDSGLNWWVTQLGSGRLNACTAFESSTEFQSLVSTLYGAAGSDNERTEHFVNNFYLGAYGRFATATELQQQRDALNAAAAQGLAQAQATAETMGRGLFAAQVNDYSISDQQFVTNLYEGFLQRGPDAGGLSFWTSNAAGGSQNRQNVLNSFATCPAFRELSGTLYRETFWLVGDHLGTPRMVADRTGSLAGIKRHDYLPFGEELFASMGGRTTGQGYSASDNVRQKFTGYERDGETNLDYAQARYYSTLQGRFTSSDPLMKSARIGSPQTFNRYSYSLNNPLRFTDPTGLQTNTDGKGNPDPCKVHKCQTDEKGNTLYIDENTGDTVYVTNAKDKTEKGDTSSIGTVGGFVAPTTTLANPSVANPAPSIARRVAGAVGKTAGRLLGAFFMILTNPIEAGGPGCPPGGCTIPVDRSANPDPEANKPDTSENEQRANLQTPLEPTPNTNPDDFEPVRGTPAKRNKRTGEIWDPDRLHKDHWEVYKNKKDFEKGKRHRSVWNDGREKERF